MIIKLTKRQNLWLIALPVGYLLWYTIKTIWFEPEVLNIESDNLLYDAKLVATGLIPFKELFTRALVPLYINAGLISLFGIHVKLSALVVHGASALALYIFGRIVFSVFRDYSVTIIAIISMMIFGVRGLPDLFLYLSIGLFLLWRQRQSFWFIIASGAVLGVSVLSYRAYIVWCAIIMIFIGYQLFDAVLKPTLKKIVLAQLWFAAGLALTLIVPLLYFIGVTDWTWMADSFMSDSMIYGYAAVLVGGFFVTFIFAKFHNDESKLAWFAPPLLLALIVLFFYRQNPTVLIKIGVIHDFARLSLWLILPFLAVGIFGALNIFKKQIAAVRPVVWTIGAVLLYIFGMGVFHISRGPSLAFEPSGRAYFMALLFLNVIIFYLYSKKNEQIVPELSHWQYIVIFLPTALLFGASLTYSEWLPTYVYNYSFGLVLGASVFFNHLKNNSTPYTKQLMRLSIISLIFVLVIFPKVTKGSKKYNPSTEIEAINAWKVVEYIQANTEPTDEIFTSVPFFALRSGRDLAVPITHPVVYTTKQNDPKPYDPYDVIPSVADIIDHLKANKIQYIILDERTRTLFRTDRHPRISKFIHSNYSVVEEYGNIKILRHNSYLKKSKKID